MRAKDSPHRLKAKHDFVYARPSHTDTLIRRANNRSRLSAAYSGHRRIPPVAVFALRVYIARDFLAIRQ
ncbi:Uncharacterised protein [Pseudomonas aeruginosa]|nr:Uncharacterised protein [Pseudomonas aeruginosa]